MGFRMIRPRKVYKRKRSINSQEVLERLESFLDESTGVLVQIVCRFWGDQQDAITYKELRQAVEDGTISDEMLMLWMQDYAVLVANHLSKAWMDAVKAGAAGQPVLDSLDKLDGLGKIDLTTPSIMDWISKHGAEFVTASTQEQKEAIAALVTKKMKDGHTVDELSRLIRPCIGLTKEQAKANARYYDTIVENLKKEHPRMKPENIRKKALDAARKYAERQHRYRAMTIAQTESAFAYNWGAYEAVKQAQALGLLGAMRKRWITSGDDSVCEICKALDGMEIGLDEEFGYKGRVLFAGQKKLPPAHPRCGCGVEYIEEEQ